MKYCGYWAFLLPSLVLVGLVAISCGKSSSTAYDSNYLDMASEEMAISSALAKREVYQEALDFLVSDSCFKLQNEEAKIDTSPEVQQFDWMQATGTGQIINRPLPDLGPAKVSLHEKAVHLLATEKRSRLQVKDVVRKYKKTFVGLQEKGGFPAIDGVDMDQVDTIVAVAVERANEVAKEKPLIQ